MSFDESGQPILNPDAPLVDPEKAFPSRRRFASKLAAELRRLPLDQPTITAINGTWGSGKSTVWNLAKRELPEDEFDILEFNPWRILDEENMVRQFFVELGLKIAAIDPDNAKERAKLWKSLSVLCGLSKSVVDTVETVATTFIPIIPTICGKSVKLALTTIEKASTTASGAATKEHEELNNLDAIRTRLSETLINSSTQKRILVIIDDLDRLTDEDIYLVIRMVKAVASLPRIHFLLLYDRPQIEAALERQCADIGTSYIAKIVQLERTLPFIPKSDLMNMVEEAIFSVRSPFNLKESPHIDRLQDLYRNAWSHILKTPRDWNRFANAFTANWGFGKSKSLLELNPIDVIGLELLHKAAPKLFQALPHEKDLLLGNDTESEISGKDAGIKKRFEELLSLAEPNDREACEFLLKFLFPHAATISKNRELNLIQTRTHLRVCHSDLFFRYFLLDEDPEVISEAELESILQVSNMWDTCLQRLLKFNKQRKFINLIDRLLDDQASLKRIGFPGPFIAALLQAADHGTNTPSLFFGVPLSATIHASWLANALIKLTPKEDRLRAWNMVISVTGSRVAVTYWLSYNDPRTPGNKADQCLLTETEAQGLVDVLRKKWPEWIKDAAWFIQTKDKLGPFFWNWNHWGEHEQVAFLVRFLIQTDEGILAVLLAICGSASDGKNTWYSLTTKNIEELIPFNEFAQAMERSRPFLQKSGNMPFLEAYNHLDKERWYRD